MNIINELINKYTNDYKKEHKDLTTTIEKVIYQEALEDAIEMIFDNLAHLGRNNNRAIADQYFNPIIKEMLKDTEFTAEDFIFERKIENNKIISETTGIGIYYVNKNLTRDLILKIQTYRYKEEQK